MVSLGKVTTLIQGVSGTPGYSVHYFALAGSAPTLAEANDITGRVRALWDAVKGQLAASVTCVVDPQVPAYDVLSGAITGIISATPPTSVVSTGTGELPPMSMAGLQLTTSNIVNRRLLQGRTFIGPLATAASTAGGVPTATLRTAVITGGTALLTGATSASLMVWHRPTAAHTGGSSSNVTSVDAALKFWSLRSRRD